MPNQNTLHGLITGDTDVYFVSIYDNVAKHPKTPLILSGEHYSNTATNT